MCIPPDFLFGFWWTLLSGPVVKHERWCDWKERPLFSQVQSPVTVVTVFLCFKATEVFLKYACGLISLKTGLLFLLLRVSVWGKELGVFE